MFSKVRIIVKRLSDFRRRVFRSKAQKATSEMLDAIEQEKGIMRTVWIPRLVRVAISDISSRSKYASVFERCLADSYFGTREQAALALALINRPDSRKALIRALQSQNPEDIYESVAWRAIGYALCVLHDIRGIDALINAFRYSYYSVYSSTPHLFDTHEDMYQFYKANRARYLPLEHADFNAFLLEDVFVNLGSRAIEPLVVHLNQGGMQNNHLCYPLRRLGWTPSTPTEKLFYVIADPTSNERRQGVDQRMTESELRAVSVDIVAKSLGGPSGLDSNFVTCIRDAIAKGYLPIWKHMKTLLGERERLEWSDLVKDGRYTDLGVNVQHLLDCCSSALVSQHVGKEVRIELEKVLSQFERSYQGWYVR